MGIKKVFLGFSEKVFLLFNSFQKYDFDKEAKMNVSLLRIPYETFLDSIVSIDGKETFSSMNHGSLSIKSIYIVIGLKQQRIHNEEGGWGL